MCAQGEYIPSLSSDVGMGGGVIIDGKLFKGGRGCGRRGCWETQVAPRAVLQHVRRSIEADRSDPLAKYVNRDLNTLTFNQVVDYDLQRDQLCRSALEEVGGYLGTGIADLANIINSQMVVMGGAFSYGLEILLPILKNTISRETLAPVMEELRVAFSEHGTDACVLGAIAVVLDDILREMALV